MLVPLFVSAFRRADELATAMEARCYRGGSNRTRMYELAYTRADVCAYLMLAVLTGLLIASRFSHLAAALPF